MKISRTSECDLRVNRISIDPDDSIEGIWQLTDEAGEVVDGDVVRTSAADVPAEVADAIAVIRAYVEAQSGAMLTAKQSERAAKIAAKASR